MTATEYLPPRKTLPSLRAAVQMCRGCPLYANATQGVFGEGGLAAEVVMVGEQPGDKEDIEGRPFVGPAGQYLRGQLKEAGIPLNSVYLTNAVKHFKWTPRGKRRLHSKPSSREIIACHPWLEAELDLVEPKMLVALGATAAQSLFGADFRITKERGTPFASKWCSWTLATYHPSALLRAKMHSGAEQMVAEFQRDLLLVAKEIHRRTDGR